MSKIITCGWCGKPLRKNYRTQKYHRGRCTAEARKEQKRLCKERNKHKYNYNNRALGNCNLSKVFRPSQQVKEIQAEKRRLRLSNLF